MVILVAPVQAQQPGRVQSFFGSLRTQFQRLYLQLPGEKSGQAVLEQMMIAMREVETARYTNLTLVEVEPDDSAAYTGQLNAEGALSIPDWFNPSGWQQQSTFRGTFVSDNVSLEAAGSWVQDGKTSYILLSEVPVLPMINLSRAKGTWIRVTPQVEGSARTDELTPEEQTQLQQATVDLFQAAEVSTARREVVDELGVFAIDIVLSDEALLTYLRRVNEIQGMDEATIQPLVQRVESTLNSLGPVTTTLYIDRASYYLRRVVVPLEAPLSAVSNSNQTGLATITIDTQLSNFNQPVIIDVPTEARELPEVIDKVTPDEESESVIDWQRLQMEITNNGEGEDETPAELDEN